MQKHISPADLSSASRVRSAGMQPLQWEPDAESMMSRVRFFDRGKTRLAAVALTRSRGLSAVTLDIVDEAITQTIR